MNTAPRRPLPGFEFKVAAPVYDEVLPRMDVAVFAGFASRGPVNVPVPVEDAAQFVAVFGADAPLARDVDSGQVVVAQLAAAVRLFFANGGRRCWVIRLARDAEADRVPVPGVMVRTSTGVAPLSLVASSPGSWADDVELAASVKSQRYELRSWDTASQVLEIVGRADAPLARGDLLRIGGRRGDALLHAGVKLVLDPGAVLLSGGRAVQRVKLDSDHMQWCDALRIPAQKVGAATIDETAVALRFEEAAVAPGRVTSAVWLSLPRGRTAEPPTGTTMIVRFGSETLLFTMRGVDRSRVKDEIWMVGDGLWLRPAAPEPLPTAATLDVERLSLALASRDGSGAARSVEELGLAPGHPRHVALLPSDNVRYHGTDAFETSAWRDTLPFPVAGVDGAVDTLCIPVGGSAGPDAFLRAARGTRSALERNGLVPFSAELFGDPRLAASDASTLLTDASYLRDLAPLPAPADGSATARGMAPRPLTLTGMHRMLEIEEATLIATPDAALPGWMAVTRDAPPPPDTSNAAPPDPRDEPTFLMCGDIVGRGPWLEATGHDDSGDVLLHWTGPADTVEFEVQESTRRNWSGAITAFRGVGSAATAEARAPGDYYYRVRGVGHYPTEWSNGVGVRLAGAADWRVRRPDEYDAEVLLATHRMMLRACAARRDAMAVLSVPAHYRGDATLEHTRQLGVSALAPVSLAGGRAGSSPGAEIPASVVVPPLSRGESDALGFGALYHGWLATRDEDGRMRSASPDGAACGLIARRGIARGAWVAPANEPLRGVITLERPASRDVLKELQYASVNALVDGPRGITVMNADTLATDDDVRPINVRRLLILLRREATRVGTTYVFEPSDDAFRRMVQRRFEALLRGLFERGAFAGETTTSAFQVRTDSSLNTPVSVDTGRFIVELRVAPARPLTFLTIRLVQIGERLMLTGA